MTGKFNIHKFKETMLTALCALIIYYISVYFLPFLVFIYPTPFIVLSIKRGYWEAAIAILLSAFGIFAMEALTAAFLITILTALVTYSMGYAIRKGFSAFKVIAIVTLLGVVTVFGLSYLVSTFNGIDIINGLEVAVRNSINEQIRIIKQMNLNLSIEELKGFMESGLTMMMALLPSLLFIMTMSIAMVNYYASTGILRRIGFGILDVPKFRNFRLPKDILRGAVIMMVGIFIYRWTGFQYTTELSLNVTLVFSFLFLLQGLAVIVYLLGIRFRQPVVVLIVVGSLFLGFRMFYLFIGILDSVFNLRDRLGRNKNE